MPYHGLIPFLLVNETEERTIVNTFQCPTTGSSHFYPRLLSLLMYMCNVSMPYHGLIPFLRMLLRGVSPTRSCFNALPRAHPISTMKRRNKLEIGKGFNALPRAHPISTRDRLYVCFIGRFSFNALPRAHPISTRRSVSSENIMKQVSMPYHGLIPFLQNKKEVPL